MQFKGLTLDDFQIESIHHIEENHSVVVSAPTGTGKTLIADYTIAKFLKAKEDDDPDFPVLIDIHELRKRGIYPVPF